jgi:hypothetical protein
VALLNRSFVPVRARNADYRSAGGDRPAAVPPDERAEYERIYHEALKAKLSAGTVHVYVLDPAGHPIDSLHVAEAISPARLTAMLERAVAWLHVAPGGPLVEPCCQSKAPAAGPGSVVLHLTARYLERQGKDLVRPRPALGSERGGSWGALPSEDWIVLTPADCKKLLPPGPVQPGTSWKLDRGVTAGLLTHFYPPTENTDVATNRLDEQELRATVLSVKDGVARARIEGRLRMRHPFYHKDTDEYVDADMVGLLDFDPGRATMRSLRLVTADTRYGRTGNQQPFGVAVRSLP